MLLGAHPKVCCDVTYPFGSRAEGWSGSCRAGSSQSVQYLLYIGSSGEVWGWNDYNICGTWRLQGCKVYPLHCINLHTPGSCGGANVVCRAEVVASTVGGRSFTR